MRPSVETLNFHHLRYFWCVVVEGGVLPASRRLRVSHPTVSAQIKELEAQLGVALFDRRGRAFELTEAGRTAFEFADRIFALGRSFLDAMPSDSTTARPRFGVGVTDDLPKLFVRRLLEPVLAWCRVVVEEERQRTLLARLAVRELDVVLSDAPTPRSFGVDAVDHDLGGSGLGFLAAPKLARRVRKGFPGSLHGASFLAPPAESQLGGRLRVWLRDLGLHPEVVAEIADSALLKTLGGDGLGVFVVPRVAEADAVRLYGVEPVGHLDELEVRFFATTVGTPPAGGPSEVLIEHARHILAAPPGSRA